MIKVIEDELVVGIITETNQFLQLQQPEENIQKDELIEQNDNNYVTSDIQNSIKKSRIRMIRTSKIRETH